MNIYRGNVLFSKDRDTLATLKNHYIVVEDGVIDGVYPVLPMKYRGVQVEDFGNRIIIPAFSDLHVHAPQYVQRGIGMDLLLEDWLNRYTFPLESKFADLEYARPIYDAFLDDFIRNGTFHASVFATIHSQATEYLMEQMEKRGLGGFVGKVNMDMDSPAYLCENTADSIAETECFLERTSGFRNVKPILTPRFAPTCSEKLMEGLGALGHKYSVGLQTHLVESVWEAARAKELFPQCGCDTEIYEKYGMMDNGPVVAAHFIFPSEQDISILKKHNGIAVHCPDATVNVIAGIMPFADLQRQGIRLALGSDVAAGSSVAVYKQIASAVRLSKLKEFYESDAEKDGENNQVSFESAFYHATKEAGSVFGKTGSLEVGYRFDALVIDNLSDPGVPLTPAQSVERFCYAGDDRNIYMRFMEGEKVK